MMRGTTSDVHYNLASAKRLLHRILPVVFLTSLIAMQDKQEKFPSTFTVDNFSSTTKLAQNEVKLPIGSRETINGNEYNPFENRQTEHATSTVGVLIHLLKGSLGTGILAMPNAFKNAGLIFGFVGTIVVGILCTHCVQLLRGLVPLLGSCYEDIGITLNYDEA
ncbi:hypothetical protein Trydic_g2651 [Trypoxylus dichotomus]